MSKYEYKLSETVQTELTNDQIQDMNRAMMTGILRIPMLQKPPSHFNEAMIYNSRSNIPQFKPRTESCEGCGNFEYTVKNNLNVCDYCGRKYD